MSSIKAILLLLPVTFTALGNECPAITDSHKTVLKRSYELGEPYGLGVTLAALAWKESTAGDYVINAVTRDFGVYQGNVKTICVQAGVWGQNFRCNQEVQSVVENIDNAARHAVETLTYYSSYHANHLPDSMVYEYMIRSYNRGWSFDDQAGDKYWKEYRAIFHQIKTCDFS